MVFQSYALYPNMTVYDNIAFSLQVRKLGKQEIDKRVQEVARLLGLEKLLQQRPKDLSGGQRQRVAIGNAIIREPKVLLMDEPLSNLDAKLRGQMRVELAELHKRLGNTIIYVTHDQTEAMTLGTRIVVMKDGIIQQIDAPKNLYENPINLFVAGFIGFPMMNMIKARIMIHEEMAYSQRGRSAYAENEMFYVFEKNRIQVTGYVKEVLLEKDYRGQDVIIGIRPEHISDRPTMNATQRITGEVIGRELLGSEIILYFSILDMQLSARVEATSTAQVGDKMDFFLETDHFCVFDEKTEENLMYH